MRLRNPEDQDYRPLAGSPAEAYGCQTFLPGARSRDEDPIPPPAGRVLRGGLVEVGGPLAEDTVWDADLIRVRDSVFIPRGLSLEIRPGTRVEFAGFHHILVEGRLRAEGTHLTPIVFTTAPGYQAEGWDGIDFLNPPAAGPGSLLAHCVFTDAVARPHADKIAGGTHRPETGGALSITGCNNLVVTSCVFQDNRAEYGGAVYVGYGSSPILAGNLFTGNRAALNGSALFSVYAFPKLVNNTIVGNTCEEENSFYLCGAVDSFNSKLVLTNNIIRDNHTPHYSGLQVVHPKAFYTRHNNIAGFTEGEGSLDASPHFVGLGPHPFRLEGDSPCRDTGTNNHWTAFLADRDMAGSSRPSGPALDMGCYEYPGDPTPAPGGATFGLALHQNSPNPMATGRGTRIAFELPTAGPVSLDVYDTRGRLVRRLLAAVDLPSGEHQVTWDGKDTRGRNCAAGVYAYRLFSGVQVRSRRLVMLP